MSPSSSSKKVEEELVLLGETKVEGKLERAIDAGVLRVGKDKSISSKEVKYDGHNYNSDNNKCQSFYCDNLLSSTSTSSSSFVSSSASSFLKSCEESNHGNEENKDNNFETKKSQDKKERKKESSMRIQVYQDNYFTKGYYFKHKTLEEYLKTLSGSIPDNLRSGTKDKGISTKRDDAPIHVEL